MKIYLWLAVASALLAAGIVMLRFGLPSQVPKIDPSNLAQVALGREVYAERCATCHGANLEGQPDWMVRKPNGRLPAPPHDASGHTWNPADQQLITITKKSLSGVVPGYESDMPAFEGLLT